MNLSQQLLDKGHFSSIIWEAWPNSIRTAHKLFQLSGIPWLFKICRSLNHYWIKFGSSTRYSSTRPCDFWRTFPSLCRVRFDIVHEQPCENWSRCDYVVFTGFVEGEDVINPNQYFLANEICENIHHAFLTSISIVCSFLNEPFGCVYPHMCQKTVDFLTGLCLCQKVKDRFKTWKKSSCWNLLTVDIYTV